MILFSPMRIVKEDNKEILIDKISFIIFTIVDHYLIFLKTRDIKIYKNYFKPKNLYKYYHFIG